MMVVNEKKPDDPLDVDKNSIKQMMLEEIGKQPDVVITLAYIYATNFTEIGEDVTKKWITTKQQTDILEQAYKKGVDDTLERMRKGFYEKGNDTSSNVNSGTRKDPVSESRRDLVQQAHEPHRRKGTKKRHKR